MVDRKKVIRGLECCVRDVRCKAIRTCDDCPYDNDGLEKPCQAGLMTDALDLIKEQAERIKGLLECATILSDALDEKEDGNAEVH